MIVGGSYLYFGKGLAFRIFLFVFPLLSMTAIVSTLLRELVFGSVEHVVMIAIIVPIYTGLVFRLYTTTVKHLSRHVVDLQSSSAQLSATAAQSAAVASQQASMVTEVSATVEEITATSGAAADNAQEIVKVASAAVNQGLEGQEAIQQALEVMVKISQVTSVAATIDRLAEQSNLLAVNASIEAAKAGEAGRGFAVVAAEVRNLAEQSREATREIRDALQLTEQGHRAIELAGARIDRLIRVLKGASDRSRQIAAATLQQATGVQQISDVVGSISQASNDSAATAQQIEEAVRVLEGIGGKMRGFVGGREFNEET